MCGAMTARTLLTIAEHQRRTIGPPAARYLDPGLLVIPVLQGGRSATTFAAPTPTRRGQRPARRTVCRAGPRAPSGYDLHRAIITVLRACGITGCTGSASRSIGLNRRWPRTWHRAGPTGLVLRGRVDLRHPHRTAPHQLRELPGTPPLARRCLRSTHAYTQLPLFDLPLIPDA